MRIFRLLRRINWTDFATLHYALSSCSLRYLAANRFCNTTTTIQRSCSVELVWRDRNTMWRFSVWLWLGFGEGTTTTNVGCISLTQGKLMLVHLHILSFGRWDWVCVSCAPPNSTEWTGSKHRSWWLPTQQSVLTQLQPRWTRLTFNQTQSLSSLRVSNHFHFCHLPVSASPFAATHEVSTYAMKWRMQRSLCVCTHVCLSWRVCIWTRIRWL